MTKPRSVALLLFVDLLAARAAAADPIRITGGSLVMNPTSGPIVLAGDREFTFDSRVDVAGGLFMPWDACSLSVCEPGDTLGLNAGWSGNDLTGPATLDGISYADVGALASSSSLIVRFVGTAVLPPLSSSATMTAPFSFTGTFFHSVDGNSIDDSLVGDGTATLTLSPSAGFPGAWHVDGAHYDFGEAAPSPTPEPGSLLLMGGGMLLLAAFVRTRARRHHPPGL
jgi:hypothetical protein